MSTKSNTRGTSKKADNKQDGNRGLVGEQVNEPVGKIKEDSPLAALIASKKKGSKVLVGLHLPEDVDEMLTKFKKDTDIDKSETVATAVRLFLKEYFE
ncbi:hypothetical protein ACPUYX_19630 [Desulfosporosinus sp. SYSU MS00001]|uniref:hypothetical protein n=1 Tax=Desulfosporosinus sp. SYSU MS00001 TaxID=3416284 RepID=UPI003CE84DAA